MQTFKRFSAARTAAEGRDIIEIRIAGRSVYIVPGADYIESVEEISVLVQETDRQGRAVRVRAGYVTPKHLKRLGNANWAEARTSPRVGSWGAPKATEADA